MSANITFGDKARYNIMSSKYANVLKTYFYIGLS